MNSSKRWNILYRGPLSSCNYGCSYCPFAKTTNTIEELRDDAERLERFVEWVAAQADREIGILFTPWGEAAIHKSYQKAMIRLSRLPNVYKVAIQTNLSGKLEWLEECDLDTVALWTTFHPTQISLERFLRKCEGLDSRGVRYSVGVVGFTEEIGLARQLRESLSPEVYLWVNAYKSAGDYYGEGEREAFQEIDPLFMVNTVRHPSLGRLCNSGFTSFSVDGEGDVTRCHFIKDYVANIYAEDFRDKLSPRPAACTNATCGCYIGYIHMPEMDLERVYGDGLLDRTPDNWKRSGGLRGLDLLNGGNANPLG